MKVKVRWGESAPESSKSYTTMHYDVCRVTPVPVPVSFHIKSSGRIDPVLIGLLMVPKRAVIATAAAKKSKALQ